MAVVLIVSLRPSLSLRPSPTVDDGSNLPAAESADRFPMRHIRLCRLCDFSADDGSREGAAGDERDGGAHGGDHCEGCGGDGGGGDAEMVGEERSGMMHRAGRLSYSTVCMMDGRTGWGDE